ncbi:hypothetical protein [Robertkochia solimangrovi]|uniref:hypothetical protein n=1 Tax=Robertkochia solimangrovi TaxID=2213046 RepID=UPI0013A5B042|nr:hypothetical protein [Robertkochia solimangrovi]
MIRIIYLIVSFICSVAAEQTEYAAFPSGYSEANVVVSSQIWVEDNDRKFYL